MSRRAGSLRWSTRTSARTALVFQGVDDVRRSTAADQVTAVNAWILDNPDFDGFFDFDAVMRDPAHPARILPESYSGHHAHPGDAGRAAPVKSDDPRGRGSARPEFENRPVSTDGG
ncbi:hypothetical protein ACFWP7_22165 [Streptomyces sp. NPDC058470]|uniref:hypothetical protein n=1 Tax=Streptomyces sp. NPDC058470 TaxID=3346515 RepID=UPI003668C2CC